MQIKSIKTLFISLVVITLLLMGIGSVLLYSYITETLFQELSHSSHNRAQSIRYEITRFMDQMSRDFLESEPEQYDKMTIAQRYFQKYGINAPLEPLEKLLDDTDDHYYVYLINKDLIVERTTFKPDLHLDFKQLLFVPDLFRRLQNNPSAIDLSRPFYEASNGEFIQYTAQAFKQGNYIIQLGHTLKGSRSMHTFLTHLHTLVPTLHDYTVYTIFSKGAEERVSVKEVWSKRFTGLTKNEIIKLWDSTKQFEYHLTKIDPSTKKLFRDPLKMLYPYLTNLFNKNLLLQTSYRKDDTPVSMIMLPQISYYHQYERSYSLLVMEFDETEAYRKVTYTKILFFTIWSSLIILILFLAYIFYKRIIYPIAALQIQMETKTPVIEPDILSKDDEVASIARTYNWLLNDLKLEAETNQTLLTQFKTFTANVIHQVRTPLSVIKISLSLLPDTAGDDTKLNIRSSIISMEHLYDSLAYTLNHDSMSFPVETLDASSILWERIALFDVVALSIDTKLETMIHDHINLEMNRTELEFLIDNNLSNALKYGKPFKPIKVMFQKTPQEIILSFESYGDAIKDGASIFKRYVQQDKNNQGTGLGLDIVSSICERYNILISLTYEDGKNIFRYFFSLTPRM